MLPSNLQFPIELEWQPVPFLKILQQSLWFNWKFGWKFTLVLHLVLTALFWSDGWKTVLLQNSYLLLGELAFTLISSFKEWRAQNPVKPFSLRIDEEGVTKKTEAEICLVGWNEIYKFDDNRYAQFNPNSTLYGKEGEVLLEWNFQFVSYLNDPTRSRQITSANSAIAQQLDSMERWEQRNFIPVASKTVNNRANMLGWTWLCIGYPMYGLPHTLLGAILFVIWNVFCITLIVHNQTLIVSPEGVEVGALFKTRRLFWKDIQRVQLNSSHTTLTFYCSDSLLTYRFRTFISVSDADKAKVFNIIRENCDLAQIPYSSNMQPQLPAQPI